MDEGQKISTESEAKRRKIRKGTHSCWECKLKKMKCIFEGSPNPDADSNASCINCQRRGTKCVSQEFEFSEESSSSLKRKKQSQKGRQVDEDHDRVVRVEALVEKLIKEKKGGNDGGSRGTPTTSENEEDSTHSSGIPTPASMELDFSRTEASCKSSNVRAYQGNSLLSHLTCNYCSLLPSGPT